jgi:hypothetical protein
MRQQRRLPPTQSSKYTQMRNRRFGMPVSGRNQQGYIVHAGAATCRCRLAGQVELADQLAMLDAVKRRARLPHGR